MNVGSEWIDDNKNGFCVRLLKICKTVWTISEQMNDEKDKELKKLFNEITW